MGHFLGLATLTFLFAMAGSMSLQRGSLERKAAGVEPTELIRRIKEHPNDKHVQHRACAGLGDTLTRNSGEEVVPIFHAMDDAIARLMSEPDPDPMAAADCINRQIMPGVFNRPYSLMLNRTSNCMDNLMTLLRKNPLHRQLHAWITCHIATIATCVVPELTPVVKRRGGFEILFDTLKNFAGDGDVMMAAWRGFSDHSHNPVGAEIIANHGGHLQGLHFMIDQMRLYPKPGFAEAGDHLTLKYEILQNVNGVLEADGAGAYGPELLAAGALGQLGRTMAAEERFRASQQVSCEVLKRLVERNASVAREAVDMGMIKVLNAALVNFHDFDPTPWNGNQFGYAYPVVPSCAKVLKLIAEKTPGSVDEMLKAGVARTLENVREDFVEEVRPLLTRLREAMPRASAAR